MRISALRFSRSKLTTAAAGTSLMRRCWLKLLGTFWIGTICLSNLAIAQETTPKLPAPEDQVLSTKDGVTLTATYYRPAKETKDTVPIILLHGHMGSRLDFDGLAKQLQAQQHAVLVPDLRGHGESTQVAGTSKELTAENLTPDQFKRMVRFDVETLKKFLMEQNNEAKLNISKLTIIGAEMGALVAANWAVMDWSWPALATGKQGQDVISLILISPPYSFKGLSMAPATKHQYVRRELAIFLIVGKGDDKSLKDATRIHGMLAKFHVDKEDLLIGGLDTSLQGTKLLNEATLNLAAHIVEFIQTQVVSKPIPWQQRKNPLGD